MKFNIYTLGCKVNTYESNVMSDKLKNAGYIEVGVDDIRSERSYDIALITKFDNKEDYLSYDINEYHVEKVKKVIKPYMESSKTVDYIS